MPLNHQHRSEWTPERIVSWAGKTGVETARFVETLMAARQHPQQGFKACLGILRFEKSYGKERLEAACKRACALGTYSYKSIESILKNNLESKPLPGDSLNSALKTTSVSHEYVRGQDYYQ
jgi:transposase